MAYSSRRLGAGPTLDAAGNLVLTMPALRADVVGEYLRHGIILDPNDPNDLPTFWANALKGGSMSWSDFQAQMQSAFGTWWPDTVATMNAQGFYPGLNAGLTAVSATPSPGTMTTQSAGPITQSAGPITATAVPISAVVTTPGINLQPSTATAASGGTIVDTTSAQSAASAARPRWLMYALGGLALLALMER